MHFQSVALSDRGLNREINEDSAWIGAQIIAVADGLGGHAGGEVASAIVINGLAKAEKKEFTKESVHDLVIEITAKANGEIAKKIKDSPKLKGMGTTLTSLITTEDKVALIHIGDSRCYQFRDGKLTQLSKDHTLVQELIDQGRLSAEEATTHPQKSLITKALMGNTETEPFIQLINVEPDDLFLLCTDGLSSVIDESEISKILREDGLTEVAAEKLKAAVYKSGAPDNITLVLAKLTDGESNLVGALGAAAAVA